MEISQSGLDLIKQFEGFVPHAYKDPGSSNGLPITIGYGSTTHLDGTDIQLGEVVTEQEAEQLLLAEVNKKTAALNGLNLTLNQNQFDALTSFIYNVGFDAFKDSTLLKVIKVSSTDPNIRNQFMRWIHNDGHVLEGLIERRKKEADLYFK